MSGRSPKREIVERLEESTRGSAVKRRGHCIRNSSSVILFAKNSPPISDMLICM